MTFDDAQDLPDAVETETVAAAVTAVADDYPTGMLASPTRIRL